MIEAAADSLTYFSQLGSGLGWQSHTEICMAWLYMDDSGEHGPDGALLRFTLGGGISTIADWEALSYEWADHLRRFSHHGIEWFHMVDFEARAKPFNIIQGDERKALLNGLLDIILRYVPFFFGTTDEPSAEPIWLRYGGAVIKTQKEISAAGQTGASPITLVLAKQQGIRAARLREMIDQWMDPSVFDFGGFGEPRKICPLQVADIVAYEFSRAMRLNKPEKERYPLTRLKSARHGCHLLSTKFLKRMEI